MRRPLVVRGGASAFSFMLVDSHVRAGGRCECGPRVFRYAQKIVRDGAPECGGGKLLHDAEARVDGGRGFHGVDGSLGPNCG